MELLNIKGAITDSRKRIYATALGYSDSNIARLKRNLTSEIQCRSPKNPDLNPEKRVVVKNCKSKELLEDYF